MDDRKNNEPKQIIVMRKDLNMPIGKMIAQGAHASMAILLQEMREGKNYNEYIVPEEDYELTIKVSKNTAMGDWLEKHFTKIVVYVKSEEKLLNVLEKANQKNLPTSLITDAGFTVFEGKPTNTCIAVGPAYPEDFIGITDKLRLLS